MSRCLFGAIADDHTGGADLGGMLSEQGVRTLQLFGLKQSAATLAKAREYEAVVVCLKTRSIPASDACRQSVEALELLRSLHARQIQFKYCSTFDSTEHGNIGPVIDALMSAMGVPFTIAVPALPVNRRTQYLGHLFVGGDLLSESPMRYHPLNPMTDSNLVRFLQKQTARRVGVIGLRAPLYCDAEIALVDAICDADLDWIAECCVDMPLITGGSGLASKLPSVWRRRGLLSAEIAQQDASPVASGTLILSGSCSTTTLDQLRMLEASGCPVVHLDFGSLRADEQAETARILNFVRPHLSAGRAACVTSSAPAEERTQSVPAERIEQFFARIARLVVGERAANRLIVAGGETAGAVVTALGITAAEIARVIDPGVPTLRTICGGELQLALKSGNFGATDFFLKTIRQWEQA